MRNKRVKSAALAALGLLVLRPWAALAVQGTGYLDRPSPPEACRPAGAVDVAAVLARAESAMGVPSEGRALHFRSMGSRAMDFQSDRSYPPFFDAPDETETWYDPTTGVELRRVRGVFPGSGPGSFSTTIVAETAVWAVRDSLIASPFSIEETTRSRRLNPWAVLHDWRAEKGRVAAAGLCTARDYPRLVLERTDPDGLQERLYLDPKTGMPVQLVRTEPHPTWGQLRSEYITAQPPDTVRIADNVFVLAHRAYNEVVVLERDTVFLLDATMSDERARQDSSWIARLFPGPHPVVVVVTDLAWPHIGGVRFWVARGATIASHAINRPFLEQIVQRRWTQKPDVLETVRATARFRFHAVTDSVRLAGGRLALHAIDGIGSEGALLAWHPSSRFLWPGDFIQDVSGPSLYATEVLRAVQRLGLSPARAAGEHVPPFDWRTVVEANAALLASPGSRRR